MTHQHPPSSSFTVSAPGSIMICGEHAVVYGHPAIVCAIDQRIAVKVRVREDDSVYIHSELADYQSSLAMLAPHPKLTFVLQAIKHAMLDTGVELTISSAINPTLGLGSSAAVTSATLAALALLKQPMWDLATIHQQTLSIIHTVQQRGSGADLAASIYGGLIAYQLDSNTNTPLIEPLLSPATATFPAAIALQYSGYKTPTAQVLAVIAEKMRLAPDEYHRLYKQMGQVSSQAIAAIKSEQWSLFYQRMDDYQTLLSKLGVCDDTLRRMIVNARRHPQTLTSKISGSGLGDCIVTLYDPSAKVPAQHTPVTIAKQGLRLEQAA